MVTPEPLFDKVTFVPAIRLRAPCVAFEVPFVLNREGNLAAFKVPELMFEALALKASAVDNTTVSAFVAKVWAADCAAAAEPAVSNADEF